MVVTPSACWTSHGAHYAPTCVGRLDQIMEIFEEKKVDPLSLPGKIKVSSDLTRFGSSTRWRSGALLAELDDLNCPRSRLGQRLISRNYLRRYDHCTVRRRGKRRAR